MGVTYRQNASNSVLPALHPELRHVVSGPPELLHMLWTEQDEVPTVSQHPLRLAATFPQSMAAARRDRGGQKIGPAGWTWLGRGQDVSQQGGHVEIALGGLALETGNAMSDQGKGSIVSAHTGNPVCA